MDTYNCNRFICFQLSAEIGLSSPKIRACSRFYEYLEYSLKELDVPCSRKVFVEKGACLARNRTLKMPQIVLDRPSVSHLQSMNYAQGSCVINRSLIHIPPL